MIESQGSVVREYGAVWENRGGYRAMRVGVAILVCMGLCGAPTAEAKSLAEAWSIRGLVAGVLTPDEARAPESYYAISAAGSSPVLVAYHDEDATGRLTSVLHVLRYDVKTGKALRRSLVGVEMQTSSWHEVDSQVSAECMGSVLSISEAHGSIEIITHINPSAGCTLVLRSDLSFAAELFGWVIARVGQTLILQENTVHFAPTHPLRIDAYDVHGRTLSTIYPAERDPAREEFAAELRRHLPSAAWCQERNMACDQEEFSADVEGVKVNEAGRNLSFDVEMNADAFGEKDDPPVRARRVHYLCAKRHRRWVLTMHK